MFSFSHLSHDFSHVYALRISADSYKNIENVGYGMACYLAMGYGMW